MTHPRVARIPCFGSCRNRVYGAIGRRQLRKKSGRGRLMREQGFDEVLCGSGEAATEKE